MSTPATATGEIIPRAILTQALKENRAAELIDCLSEGGAATVDPIKRKLVLYPAQFLREMAGTDLTADDLTDSEIADLKRRGYIAVKLPEIATDQFGDRVIEVPLSDQPHDKGTIRLDQGQTGTNLAITGIPSTLAIEHAPPYAAALLAAYAATTGHAPSQATVHFGPIGWTGGTYDGPGTITRAEPTGEFNQDTIDELANHPGEPLWVDRTQDHPHLHIDAQNGTWIYKLTLETETRQDYILTVYSGELINQPAPR